MRGRVLFTLLLAVPALLRAQETVGIGGWRSYQSQAAARGAAVVGSYAVKLSDIGLVTIDRSTGEVKEWTKPDGLYSARPTAVVSDAVRSELIVGYADGTYERWADDGTTLGLRRRSFDIARSSFLSRGVRCGWADATTLYLGTDFGLVAFNSATNLVRFTARQFATAAPEQAVRAVVTYGGRLYVMVAEGLYSAPLTAPNLADAMNWRAEHGQGGLPATGLTQLAATTGRLFAVANDVLYVSSGGAWSVSAQDNPSIGALSHLTAAGDAAVAIRNRSTIVMADAGGVAVQLLGRPQAVAYLPGLRQLAVADAERGLVLTEVDFTTGTGRELRRAPFTLPSNGCRQIAAGGGRLYVAPTGHTGRYQPGFSETGVYRYDKATGQWRVFDRANGGLDATVYYDLGALWLEPGTQRCHYASWGQGVVTLDGDARTQVLNNVNSPIPGLAFNPMTGRFDVLYLGGVAVDSRGVLWVTSFDASPPLAARTPQGQWVNLPLVAGRPLEIVVDRAGRKWILLADQNLAVYDDRSNVTATSTHRQRLLTPAAGQGALPGTEVLAVADDRDGLVWLGTSQGVGVFYNPSATVTGSAGGDARCPVIDGRCLLRDERVQTIAVDGANRKWMGTTRGLFLITPDGQQVLARYTEANSPLVSDDVRDLAYDPTTGELFIATDLGIVSLRTDATEGGEETSLRVFPNPAYVGDDTPITIDGIAEGASCLVTTASGERVARLTVNGGRALWNGRDELGRRAGPGVYLILAARADGSSAGSTKLAITER